MRDDMSLFSIADLHLSLAAEKPMDVFGPRWTDHAKKIEKNWRAIVTPEDTVVLPGDISWAMSLEEASADFAFLDALPGRKLIGKGNHDFWWSTMTKLNAFTAAHGFSTLRFLYNNAYEVEDYIVCGTRGWYIEERQQNAREGADYKKIVAREAARLRMSLAEAVRLRGERPAPILVYLHFPPAFRGFVCRELIDVLHEFSVRRVYFGHIHGVYSVPRTVEFEEILLTMISADFLNFVPMITMPCDF